ncbi:MAG: HEAT repeat domain-containing protein, partial [Planctomycetota bacterium]
KRLGELEHLASSIGNMTDERQQYWLPQLKQVLENDKSPAIRWFAVKAAGRIRSRDALQLVEMGLEDESIKVQMAACEAMGKRTEPEAGALLAKVVGSSQDHDVRLTAVDSLGSHTGDSVRAALRQAVQKREPAIRITSIASLKRVTGQDFGNDVDAWVAYLDGEPGETIRR